MRSKENILAFIFQRKQKSAIFANRKKRKAGCVAQLDRASDYGSEG